MKGWGDVEFSLVIFLPEAPGAGVCSRRKGYRRFGISRLLLGSLTLLRVIRGSVGLHSTSN